MTMMVVVIMWKSLPSTDIQTTVGNFSWGLKKEKEQKKKQRKESPGAQGHGHESAPLNALSTSTLPGVGNLKKLLQPLCLRASMGWLPTCFSSSSGGFSPLESISNPTCIGTQSCVYQALNSYAFCTTLWGFLLSSTHHKQESPCATPPPGFSGFSSEARH